MTKKNRAQQPRVATSLAQAAREGFPFDEATRLKAISSVTIKPSPALDEAINLFAEQQGGQIAESSPQPPQSLLDHIFPEGYISPVLDTTTIPLNVKRLHRLAELPRYATPGAACFDIATIEGVHLAPGQQRVLPTGLAFEVPDGHVLLVYSRSGHGFKYGVRLANGTGVIDSDFRGELKLALRNDSDTPFICWGGDRIAQGMLVPIPRCEIVEVEELSTTERGEGGLGSTGT